MERSETAQIEQALNHELQERFAAGAVQRGVLLRPGDDPAIGPGELMVRVFLPPPDRPEGYEQALGAWQDIHRPAMEELRRELSLRLPEAGCWSSPLTTRTPQRRGSSCRTTGRGRTGSRPGARS